MHCVWSCVACWQNDHCTIEWLARSIRALLGLLLGSGSHGPRWYSDVHLFSPLLRVGSAKYQADASSYVLCRWHIHHQVCLALSPNKPRLYEIKAW